jgi:hypothetical protein
MLTIPTSARRYWFSHMFYPKALGRFVFCFALRQIVSVRRKRYRQDPRLCQHRRTNATDSTTLRELLFMGLSERALPLGHQRKESPSLNSTC